jgi:hypothetical protein
MYKRFWLVENFDRTQDNATTKLNRTEGNTEQQQSKQAGQCVEQWNTENCNRTEQNIDTPQQRKPTKQNAI